MSLDFSKVFLAIVAMTAALTTACGESSTKELGALSDAIVREWNYSVNFIEPKDGATLTPPLTIIIGAKEVDEIALIHNQTTEIARQSFDGVNIVLFYDKIPAGTHKFSAVGYDIDGNTVAGDSITVTIK
ncbi:MAG: hypothetical protein Kow0090_02190 [Myxococcota bacterium]